MTYMNLLALNTGVILALTLATAPQSVHAEDYQRFNPNGHDEGIDIVEPVYTFEEQLVRGEDASAFIELLEGAGIEKENLARSRVLRIEGSAFSCFGQGASLVCEVFDPKTGRNRRLEGESAKRWAELLKKYSKEGSHPTVKCEIETLRLPVFSPERILPRPRKPGENYILPMPVPSPSKEVSSLAERCRVIVPKLDGFR